MHPDRRWLSLLCAGLLVPVCLGQYTAEEDFEPEEPARVRGLDDPNTGLFFNPIIIDRAIDRITDEMGRHYEFDEDQLYTLRQEVKARFPQWLNENRDNIVVAINQYAGALLGDEPPDPQDVADWAGTTRPLTQNFFDLMEDTAESIRPIMTEEQQIKLDGELAMMRVGMNYMDKRLARWEAGEYDWETEWFRSERFREEQRAREAELRAAQEEARQAAIGDRLDEIGSALDEGRELQEVAPRPSGEAAEGEQRPKGEWELYVDAFIKRYELNDDQQAQCRRFLRESVESRDSYLRRKLEEIEKLEEQLTKAENETQRATVREGYERVMGPVQRQFERLKRRLDALPTREQRIAAARRDQESSETKPADETARRTTTDGD
jgi:hypothetical protein